MAKKTIATCTPGTDVSKLQQLQTQALLVWALAWVSEWVETRPVEHAEDARRTGKAAKRMNKPDAAAEQKSLEEFWTRLVKLPVHQRVAEMEPHILEDDSLEMELELRDGGPGTFGRMVYEAVHAAINQLKADPNRVAHLTK